MKRSLFCLIAVVCFAISVHAQIPNGSLCFPTNQVRGEFNGRAVYLPFVMDIRPGDQTDVDAAVAAVAAGNTIGKASANVLVGATQSVVLDVRGVDSFYIQWRKDMSLGTANLTYGVYASIPSTTSIPDPTDMVRVTLTQKTNGTGTTTDPSDENIYYGESMGASSLLLVATAVSGSTGTIAWTPASK